MIAKAFNYKANVGTVDFKISAGGRDFSDLYFRGTGVQNENEIGRTFKVSFSIMLNVGESARVQIFNTGSVAWGPDSDSALLNKCSFSGALTRASS
jgi:hypothetical protein